MVRVELSRAQWREREAAHGIQVDELLAGHLARRARGERHPVEDFLHTYYSFSPGQLRRWHPGAGVVLAGAAGMPRASWPFSIIEGGGVRLDVDAFVAARSATLASVRTLVSRTAARVPQLGCFGLHEWAMVYRQDEGELRHRGWPLRLGRAGTADVVESHQLRCTHVDAFRFFTPDAARRNLHRPTRERQPELEQPGCLHAGMDLYKWCYKLTPLTPSELTLDAFELARDIRVLDMEAAPYDLRDLGVAVLPIETPEGKAAYITRQRAFTARANALRARLLAVIDALEPGAPGQEITADGCVEQPVK